MPPQPQLLPDFIGGLTSLTVLKIDTARLIELHSSIGELVAMKHLCLRCPQLGNLPCSIGKLTSLLHLDISYSGIKELPDSIGDLKWLKILKADRSMIHHLPESIGMLESLNELSLMQTKITELPETIGNLKMLKVINLGGTPITKLPKSIGKTCNLEMLFVWGCKSFDGTIPEEIGELSSLKCIELTGTPISRVPTTINQLSHLQKLYLGDFDEQLPKLPASLVNLQVFCSSLDLGKVPDLSNLANLVIMKLCGSPFILNPRVITSEMEWLVSLTKLEELALVFSNLTLPPIDLNSLCRLRELTLTCFDLQHLIQLPPKLEYLNLCNVKVPLKTGCSIFSSLKNVFRFELYACQLTEVQVDALGELENLCNLTIRMCGQVERLSGLSCLKNLRELMLSFCPNLIDIQGLEEIKMLQSLYIWKCDSLQRLPDLSSLQKLESLTFRVCRSLRSLPDVTNKETCNLKVMTCPPLHDFEGLYHQFLDEDESNKKIVHWLNKEFEFCFDIKLFEDVVKNGNWDEVERYFCGFSKLDDNKHSMDMFFIIRRMKFLEALDRNDRSKAKEILMKNLEVFSKYYEDHLKTLAQALTMEDIRRHEQLSWYRDTKSARACVLRELKKLIIDFCEEKQRIREVEKAEGAEQWQSENARNREVEKAEEEARSQSESGRSRGVEKVKAAAQSQPKKEEKENQGQGKPLGFGSRRSAITCSILLIALTVLIILINQGIVHGQPVDLQDS